ncbi:MAG: hypothetical protein JXB35_14535 [Anaerolineae bacterium]|nr:hypothetical protein [Anaerolineae bacterium]
MHVALDGPTSVTLGSFDGVHRGHQALIASLVQQAQASCMQAVVVTFDPLPRQLFQGLRNWQLTSLDERIHFMTPLGMDGVAVLQFDRRVRAIPAEAFVLLLKRHLGMAALWAGPDFALGRDREGDVAFLKDAGQRHDFDVHIFHRFRWQGRPVRSTQIRQALHEGNLALANDLLGRPYRLTGTVAGVEAAPGAGRVVHVAIPPERLLPEPETYLCRVLMGALPLEVSGVITQERALALRLPGECDVVTGRPLEIDFCRVAEMSLDALPVAARDRREPDERPVGDDARG